jgi:hypothetical protein
MAYIVRTERETYTVDDEGNIGRPLIGLKPSGNWKVQGLVRRNNFGVLHYVAFADWSKQNFAEWSWHYKNGKPKYHLRDLDHGTTREQGSKVLRIDPA